VSSLDKAFFKHLFVQVAHAEYERLVKYTAQTLRDNLSQVMSHRLHTVGDRYKKVKNAYVPRYMRRDSGVRHGTARQVNYI